MIRLHLPRLVALSCMLWLLLSSQLVFAQTTVNSNITSNTTWSLSGSPYQVSGEITVATGALLTIEAGVRVEMGANASIIVDGGLAAAGTSASRITFTSAATSPAAGDWGTVRFNNLSDVGSRIAFTDFEYGGGNNKGALITYVTGAYGFAISNSTFQHSAQHGVDTRASSPQFFNSTFNNNAGYGIYSELALNFELNNATISNNGVGGVRIPINSSPTITRSTIENNPLGFYIDAGATPNITFNEIRNNAVGIEVIEAGNNTPNITDNNFSGHSELAVKNSGIASFKAEYNFWNDKTGPTTSANFAGRGDRVDNNIDFTPWLYGATLPTKVITNPSLTQYTLFADTVYIINDDVTLVNRTLTLQAGAVVKFADGTGISLQNGGSLIAEGDAENYVYFTSILDDAIGGDSNGDGRNSQPVRGAWDRLSTGSGSGILDLAYTDIRWGGRNNSGSNIFLNTNTWRLSHVGSSYSSGNGIHLRGTTNTFINITATNNNGFGIYVDLITEAFPMTNIVANNNGRDGIFITTSSTIGSGDFELTNITAQRNTQHGVEFSFSSSSDLGVSRITESNFSYNGRNGLNLGTSALNSNPSSSLVIDSTTASYNGAHGLSVAMRTANKSTVAYRGNTLIENGNSGIRSSSATFIHNYFIRNEFPIAYWNHMDYDYPSMSSQFPGDNLKKRVTNQNIFQESPNIFTDNTFSYILIDGLQLSGTLQWSTPTALYDDSAYGTYLYSGSSSTVTSSDTLTIEPRVIIKAGYTPNGSSTSAKTFDVEGILYAVSDTTAPIVFTSWRDDRFGGRTALPADTNSARAGDWSNFNLDGDAASGFNRLAEGSRLSNVHFYYGTQLDFSANAPFQHIFRDIRSHYMSNYGLVVNGGSITFDRLDVQFAGRSGVWLHSPSSAYSDLNIYLRRSTISNNGEWGIYAATESVDRDVSIRELSNSIVANNGRDGIWDERITESSTLLGNIIEGNGRNGVYYQHRGEVLAEDIYYTGNQLRNNAWSGIISSAATFVDNTFEGNEIPISHVGRLGHSYVDENGVDGNVFNNNTFNNVVGLRGYLLSGTLDRNFPLAADAGVYLYLADNNSVINNDSLTIVPGTVIKSGYKFYGRDPSQSNTSLYFDVSNGTLIANGTEEEPIVFTSFRDDRYGGRTTLAADTASARPGDWAYLNIENEGIGDGFGAHLSELSYVNIFFGGASWSSGSLRLDLPKDQLFQDEIDHLRVEQSANEGIVLYGFNRRNNFQVDKGGQFTIAHSIIEDNEDNGIELSVNSQLTLRSSTLQRNGENGIYSLAGGLIREVSNSQIRENGSNGIYQIDAPFPITYQFNTIESNGGNGIAAYSAATTDSVITIAGNTIRNNTSSGIVSSWAAIVDNTIENNLVPITVSGQLSRLGFNNGLGNFYSGNTIGAHTYKDAIGVQSTIKGFMGYYYPESYTEPVHIPLGWVTTIPEGDSVTVAPGTVFKWGIRGADQRFTINGELIAEGEVDKKIIFTSIYDDTNGGDTNQDADATLPNLDDWSSLYFTSTNANQESRLKHTIVRYADENLYLVGSQAVVNVDSSVVSNADYGAFITGSNAQLNMSYTDVHSNNHGIYTSSSAAHTIRLNNIYDNSDYGYYSRTHNQTAINNFWGHESGPFVDEGPDLNTEGTGNRLRMVSGAVVTYRPFLTSRVGILLGDVSEANGITAFDASLILQAAVNTTTLSPTQRAAADVTGDGSISAMDASYVLRYVVSAISGFPAGKQRIELQDSELAELYFEQGEGFVDLIIHSTGAMPLYAADLDLGFGSGLVARAELIENTAFNGWQQAAELGAHGAKIALAGVEPITQAGEVFRLRLYPEQGQSIGDLSRLSLNLLKFNDTQLQEHFGGVLTDLAEELELPAEFGLEQNYPNPFNPSTQIAYSLPVSGQVSLQVFNMLGQRVATLVNNERQTAGRYSLNFEAAGLTTGMYIYRIQVQGADGQRFSDTRKMTFLK